MIVGAADHALRDFLFDSPPTVTAPDHLPYLDAFGFWVDMVKVKNRWIRLAAVHARMRQEIPLPDNPLM